MGIVHRVRRHAPLEIFLLLHARRSILAHSGSTNVQTVHIFTFGTQQYWITEITKNNRVAFVAT